MNLINSTFTVEGFTALPGRLHGSQGDTSTKIGVYPVRTTPEARNKQVGQMYMMVQFYGQYDLQVDRTFVADPTLIESYAERFREALRTGDPNTADVWYFSLINVNYPEDPTGQVTRFEATVMAWGNNSALIETSG